MEVGNPGDALDGVYAYLYAEGDRRTAEWWLMSSPVWGYLLCAIYLFIIWGGKKVMMTREPFNIKYLVIVYNATMVALNGYMAIVIAYNAFFVLGYGFRCNGVDYSDRGYGMAAVLWWFYFSKFIEFLDTIFFVARKKFHLVTFLHLYHHTTMPLLWWLAIRFTAGGECYLSAMINSCVHVIMYSYYGLRAAGYSVWWKKYLTQLQMAQFVFLMIHGAYGAIFDCKVFPNWMAYALVAYMISMLTLFLNFYLHSYKAKPKSKET
ncbi:GNS1/SUR4 family protein [Thecamonas trahens ATCC 50062]|uniref:Elongation of fatty acids protein n=1 Tax=Thecamonas trahens ATCC 50062 TaxID=461836 RepID=A0A0L0D7X4_THETB|nr:GNS1/SUR4 family protein [Thecamonas trahens ATCC 50062]KNC48305.1 GNS1/SUR4 family protein [Thecamonas trahens ATCC 50062]|eukprot:XP_013758872.1 GNS1/SUR4 family protein [Thecamonas trahens ATCC 50062]